MTLTGVFLAAPGKFLTRLAFIRLENSETAEMVPYRENKFIAGS
jgi:hypothetical protein